MSSLVCLGSLVLLASAASAGGGEDLSTFVTRVKPSVVYLDVLDSAGESHGNGTGFFISADGMVVTNHHVIEGAEQMKAVLSDGTRRTVLGVLASDPERDVALVQVEGSNYPALPLGDAKAIKEGLRVLVVGNPMGLQFTVSDGIISAAHREVPERYQAPERRKLGPLIQITAPIAPGSSGSPVLTLEGQVIGVAQAVILGGGNLGFAIPVEAVKDLRKGVTSDTKPRPLRPFPLRNAIVSAVLYGGLGAVVLWGWLRKRRAAALKPGKPW